MGPVVYWDARDILSAEGAGAGAWGDRVAGCVFPAPAIQPTFRTGGINGNPAVEFSSCNPYVCSQEMFSGIYTGFSWVMAIQPAETVGIPFAIGILSLGNANPQSGTQWGANGAVSQWWLNTTSNPMVNNWCWQGGFDTQAANVAKHRFPMQPMVMGYNYDGAAGVVTIWIDGACVGVGSAPPSVMIEGGVSLGVLFSDYINNFKFRVGALAAWDRTLSPSEMRGASQDLFARCIADHRPRVMLVGDSFIDGTAAAAQGTLADYLQSVLSNVRVMSGCIPGVTGQVQASMVTPYDNLYNSLRAGDRLVIGPPQISIGNGTSVEVCLGIIATIAGYARTQGAQVITVTAIPKHYSADGGTQTTRNTARTTLNGFILANAMGADAVVDPCALAEFTSDTAYEDATYYTDDTVDGHPTAAAYEAMKAIFATAINAS